MTGDEIPTKLSKGSGESDNERPQRMKDWLIEQINSNSYEGLQWVDEEKTIFRVPWIHAKKRGYNAERDAALFRAWAKHTGKYKGEGDATTWKINFRCALNGLKDIVELKDNQTENFRMYRLLPDTRKIRSGKGGCPGVRPPRKHTFTDLEGRRRSALFHVSSGPCLSHVFHSSSLPLLPTCTGLPMYPTYHLPCLPPYVPPDGFYDVMGPPCAPCRWPPAVFPPTASFIAPDPPICISYPSSMEEMKPFPQVVGGIQMAPPPVSKPMPMPCISTAPPLGPPPQVSCVHSCGHAARLILKGFLVALITFAVNTLLFSSNECD